MKELDYEQREVVLRVDFDDLDDEDNSWISMRFLGGPRHPREGEIVYLLDCEGGGCMAEIVQVRGWSARVKPDWSSWRGDGEAPRLAERTFEPTA